MQHKRCAARGRRRRGLRGSVGNESAWVLLCILIENIQLMKELLSIIDDKAGRKAIMNDIKDTQQLLKLM